MDRHGLILRGKNGTLLKFGKSEGGIVARREKRTAGRLGEQ